MPKKPKKTLEERVKELQERVREALLHDVPSIQEFVELRGDLHNLRNHLDNMEDALAVIPSEPRWERWADGSWRLSASQCADLSRRLGYLDKRLNDVEADIYKYNPTTEVAKRIKQRVADRERPRDAEETVSEPHRGRADAVEGTEPRDVQRHIERLLAYAEFAKRLPSREELARKWHELECGDMVPYAESAPGYRQEMLRTAEGVLAWLREREGARDHDSTSVSEPHRGRAEGTKTASEYKKTDENIDTNLQECVRALTRATVSLDAGIRRFFRGDIVVAGDAPKLPTAEALARKFHDLYEMTAHQQGWHTQPACQVPFDDLPEANRKTMLLTAEWLLNWLRER